MGGPNNPPDRPYVVLTLDDDDDKATGQLQAARKAGFEVLFAFPFSGTGHGNVGDMLTRVILGNYQKGS